MIEDFLPPKKTSVLMLSSMAAVIICIYFKQSSFPFWLPGMLVYVFDLFMHELGHTIFGFLFGLPSIPILMFTKHFARSEILQGIMYMLMIGGGWWLWRAYYMRLFYAAIIFTVTIITLSLTPYYELVILYMGHGTSIIGGGIIVYIGWRLNNYSKSTNHWFIGFAGYSMLFHNIYYFYNMRDNPDTHAHYHERTIFGMHNDFVRIAEQTGLTVTGIALFTICFAVMAFVLSFLFALFMTAEENRTNEHKLQ